MQTTESPQLAVRFIGPDTDSLRQVLRDPLEGIAQSPVFSDNTNQATTADDGPLLEVVVCTATAIDSASVSTAERTAGEWLIVVDTGSPTEIDLAAETVPTSYIHAESPPAQIRSQLQTIVTAVRSGETAHPRAEASSTANAVADKIGIEVPIPVVIATVDSRRVIAVNDAAVTLFDQPRASLVDRSLSALQPTPTAERWSTLRETAVETGRVSYGATDDGDPVTVRSADGEAVPVDYTAVTTTVDGTGYLIETFEPATEQVDRLTTLQQQSIAMDVSLTGISILSPTEEYVYMNEAHAEIFEYEPSELLGKTWRALYDEERQGYIESTVFPALAANGSWEGELTGQRADGTPVEQHVSLTALPDGGLVCVNRDISDRKRTERQLHQLRETVSTFMLADDRPTVIDTAIEAITDIIDLPVVAYYRRKDDALWPETVSPKAQTVLDDIPAFEAGEGLIWTAIETGSQQYYPDLQSVDGRYNPETVLRSELQLPVGDDGVVIIGSTTPDAIAESEQELLGILVDYVETALTLLDRTEQLQQAKATAVAERQQLRTVIDSVPQLLCAQAHDGRIIFANEAVATAFDTTTAAIEGTTPADSAAAQPWMSLFETDDQPLAPGESQHLWGETVTDADGKERVLETWHVGFEPVDHDESAQLFVSNDVTELEEAQTALTRLQRLKAHHKVGDKLLQTRTPEEVCTIGSQAIADGLSDATVSVYRWDESAALLTHVSTDPVTDTAHPTRITMDDTERWRAFTQETVTVSESGGVSVPIGDDGLLVVSVEGDSPSTEAVEFLESAADTLAIGIRQARQKASIDDLESETEQLATDVSRQRTLLGSFTTAIATAVRAESRTELFETLTEFCEANWEYAWVGSYHPEDETVSPTVVGSPGGPATTVAADGESGRSPPMLAAATGREPVYIKNTRATQPRSAWARRLLTYGYQSAIAVPICESGVLHGVVEVTASETAKFDEQARQLIVVLCQAVAIRLNQLNRSEPTESDDEAVVFELVCNDDRPLFPSLPAAASVDLRTISTIDSSTRTLTVSIEGITADRFERYVRDTPGFAALVVAGDRTDGDHVRASVQLTTTARDQTHQLFETARRNDAAITTAQSHHANESIRIRARRPAVVGDIVDTLQQTLDCRLVSKQTSTATDLFTERQQITATLTDRQRELFRTAYREGYYEQPKGISGGALADLFDLSQSTVHEHLRSAEQQVAAVLFDDTTTEFDTT